MDFLNVITKWYCNFCGADWNVPGELAPELWTIRMYIMYIEKLAIWKYDLQKK